MDNISFAEALEPDVIQYIVQGARDAGTSVNAFLRLVLRVPDVTMCVSTAQGMQCPAESGFPDLVISRPIVTEERRKGV